MLIFGDCVAEQMEGEGLPTVILAFPPRTCPECNTVKMTFINRWGSSRCSACDRKLLPGSNSTSLKGESVSQNTLSPGPHAAK